jgi:hypothetical protein
MILKIIHFSPQSLIFQIGFHSSYHTYIGPFFQSASQGYASNPEIVLYSGDPVVAWEEDSGSNIYIAKWNGSEWIIFENCLDMSL